MGISGKFLPTFLFAFQNLEIATKKKNYFIIPRTCPQQIPPMGSFLFSLFSFQMIIPLLAKNHQIDQFLLVIDFIRIVSINRVKFKFCNIRKFFCIILFYFLMRYCVVFVNTLSHCCIITTFFKRHHLC